MVPRSLPSRVLPLLSFVAGYVDGCTYLALFGLFIAQVTGSFVLTDAQLVTPSPGILVKLVGIQCSFSPAWLPRSSSAVLSGVRETLCHRRSRLKPCC